MRVGIGYDVHVLVDDRDLVIGGVTIPHKKGLLGHSDADVLIHSIIDALLGGAALGDIGTLFPDNDDTYRGISSIKLLYEVGKILEDNRYIIENIDGTIIAQLPKMKPYIQEMRINIADALEIDIEQVSVKATTEEGLGFTGSEKGIAAQAICLLNKITNLSSFDINVENDLANGPTCGGCRNRSSKPM